MTLASVPNREVQDHGEPNLLQLASSKGRMTSSRSCSASSQCTGARSPTCRRRAERANGSLMICERRAVTVTVPHPFALESALLRAACLSIIHGTTKVSSNQSYNLIWWKQWGAF